ncbi:hypothetical protein ES703_35070 [subsurface metagenome]
MIDTNYEDMKKLVATQVCAQCGGELTIRTNPQKGGELEVGCPHHLDHHGYVERETYTQAFRRGAEVHPAIRDAIERKMVPKDDLGRAMNLLALRYPSAIVDPPTAALFILDCARLDIDPLISPAEAVPVPFKSKRKDKKGNVIEEKTTITMVITEDGWLSMAARGCRDDWVGPPRTMRLEEYLTSLPENRDKPREEVLAIAREIKESKCKDPEAWYYVAIGKRRGGDDTVTPGYFTHSDHGKAERGFLPAATQPGNQARVRAIKRWVREVFPECRQRMMELTAEWYQRAEGIQAAQEYIDAEYSFISLPEGEEETGKATGGKVGAAAPTKARAQAKKAEAAPLAEEKSPDEVIEGEGFHIDLTWLQESQKALKWSDDTCKTFLVKYKVSPQGTLTEVLQRLTREQAEDFVNEINSRVEKQQPGLFE